MRQRVFDDVTSCLQALEGLLADFIRETSASSTPVCAILAGGATPLPAYRAVAALGLTAPDNLCLALSDERMVAHDHPESNYGQILPLFDGLGLQPGQVLYVNSRLSLEQAAADFNHAWATFFSSGGRLSLSILGLGADGHTASLFSMDATQPQGRWAVPVLRESGPNRVSVTRDLLSRSERTVLVCPGESKREIVRQFLSAPESVIAARVLCDCPNVELWTT